MSQKITVSKDVFGTLFLPSLGNVQGGQEIYIQDDILDNKDIQKAISRKLLILNSSKSSQSQDSNVQTNVFELRQDQFIKIVNKKNNDLCFDSIRIDGNSSIYSKGAQIMTSFAKLAMSKGLIQVFDRSNNKILINNMGQFYKDIIEKKIEQPVKKQEVKKEENKKEQLPKGKKGKQKKSQSKTVKKEQKQEQETISQEKTESKTNPLVWNIQEQKAMNKDESFKQMFSKKKEIDLEKDNILEKKPKEDGNKKLNNLFKKQKQEPTKEDKETVKDLISKLNDKNKLPKKQLPPINSFIKSTKKQDIKFVDADEENRRIANHPILSQLNNNEVE